MSKQQSVDERVAEAIDTYEKGYLSLEESIELAVRRAENAAEARIMHTNMDPIDGCGHPSIVLQGDWPDHEDAKIEGWPCAWCVSLTKAKAEERERIEDVLWGHGINDVSRLIETIRRGGVE